MERRRPGNEDLPTSLPRGRTRLRSVLSTTSVECVEGSWNNPPREVPLMTNVGIRIALTDGRCVPAPTVVVGRAKEVRVRH
jgi:hypothetical protein